MHSEPGGASGEGGVRAGVPAEHLESGRREDARRDKRVLLDLVASSAGGQSKRAAAFLRRLRNVDPKSNLLVVRQSGSLGFLENGGRTQVIDVALQPGRLRGLRRMLWQNRFLPGMIRRGHVDTYVTFSHYLPWTMPTGVRTIVGVSNLAPFSPEAIRAETSFLGRARLRLLKRTMLSSARRATMVIALSETCRDILIEHGIPGDKIVVIPNGLDEPKTTVGVAKEDLVTHDVNGEYLLYVSNFQRYKNFERLVDAYARLPEALRNKHQLVIVGHPDDLGYFEEIMERIDRLGMNDQIKIIPGLENAKLASLYAKTTLFVFPSLVETCPNILLEAMSHGAPVLTGAIGPMPEFGGSAARYFDPLSVESIAREISEVLANAATLEEMRTQSRERARRYSWDDFTSKVVSLYAA